MDKRTNTNKIWEHLNNARLVRYLLLFALAWAIAQVLAYFETVLVIFILAAILAFLLNYPVKWACRLMPRWLAVILVFLLALLVLGGLMATLGLAAISQAQQLLQQAPQFLESAISLLENLRSFLQSRNITVDFKLFEAQLREQALGFIGMGFTTIQTVLFSVLDLILIAVVSFFMLLDGRQLWNLIMKLFSPRLRQELIEAIQKNFLGFFWGRLLLSLFLAGLVGDYSNRFSYFLDLAKLKSCTRRTSLVEPQHDSSPPASSLCPHYSQCSLSVRHGFLGLGFCCSERLAYLTGNGHCLLE